VVGDATRFDFAPLLGAGASGGGGEGGSGAKVDVVLSDMAPNTSGHGDDLLSARLCHSVLDVAAKWLRPGGNLVMKVLEGSEYPDLLKRTAGQFREARGLKPAASRDVSREIFIYALGFKGA
jgi:23S rRNA (uridine2552-2'-O)-methyltransferase